VTQRLAVISFFRNSAGRQIDRFLNQCALLAQHCPYALHVNAVFGDCTDDTANQLLRGAEDRALSLQLIEASHGGPVFGSTEHTDRLKALSFIGNRGLESVNEHDDFVFYVESDLIWRPDTVTRLLATLSSFSRPGVLAPLTFAGPHFYDVFCFRGLDGERFAPFPPYHSELDRNGLTAVSSVGSGFVMHAEVARNCRILDQNVLIGFCKDVIAHEYPVVVDARERFEHPA
jgi:hypothetical protein